MPNRKRRKRKINGRVEDSNNEDEDEDDEEDVEDDDDEEEDDHERLVWPISRGNVCPPKGSSWRLRAVLCRICNRYKYNHFSESVDTIRRCL